MTYDVLAPNATNTRKCDATFLCSHFIKDTNLSYRHSQFKKIRGWVAPQNKKK